MKELFLLMLSSIIAFHSMAQNVVDVHCHNILPEYLSMLERHNATLDETFPLPGWSLAEHKELSHYTDIFLWKNAYKLFNLNTHDRKPRKLWRYSLKLLHTA